jgi:short-subunit dehydrogenase
MAAALACHTKGNAHIVLVGRNRATTESVPATFPKPGPGVTHEFIECDMTPMSNVHRAETGLRARLQKINFLMLTPGVLTMDASTASSQCTITDGGTSSRICCLR